METENNTKLIKNTALFILFALTVLTLKAAGFIIFPIVFAFFASLALLPISNKLEQWSFSRFWSSITVVIALTIFLAGVFVFLSFESYDFINELSEKKDISPNSLIDSFTKSLKSEFDMRRSSENQTIDKLANTAVKSTGLLAKYLFSSIKSALVFLSLLPIYIFFMLYYRDNFKGYLNKSLTKSKKEKHLQIIRETKTMIQKYLLGLVLVIVIVSVLNSIGLFFIGLKHAILLGSITGILIIIPYIGVFMGALIPTLIAYITFDSIWYPASVLILYGFIQFLEGNYITPSIVGNSVNLNPLVIIIGIIIFGSIGGILAMIIAVPTLATIKIYLDHSNTSHLNILMEHKQKEIS